MYNAKLVVMASKKLKVEITKAPAPLGLAYHPGQTAEVSEALAKELIDNGFAELPVSEKEAPKKAAKKSSKSA